MDSYFIGITLSEFQPKMKKSEVKIHTEKNPREKQTLHMSH
jgi:hypothetical protein